MSKRPLLLGLLLGLSMPLALQAQAHRNWIGGTTATSFSGQSGYDGSGGLANDHLHFNGPVSPSLTTASGFNFRALHIESGADGFRLSGGSPTGIVLKDGFYVSANTSAVIDVPVIVYNYTDGTPLVASVGSGGSLTFEQVYSSALRPFIKTGEGTLFLTVGSGVPQYVTGVQRFEQGTVVLGDAAVIKRSDSVNKTLPVSLGTSTTTARLSGGGTIDGILTTAGTDRSIIQTGGDGTLSIATLNAGAGATFDIRLGHLISGSGAFTGEDLAFDLSGGVANTVYTLFDYAGYVIDTSTFTINTPGYVLDTSFGTNGWNLSGSQLQVSFTAVPEPGAIATFAIGVALLGLRRRRA